VTKHLIIMLLLKQIQSLFSAFHLMQTNKAQLISRKFMITQIITNNNILLLHGTATLLAQMHFIQPRSIQITSHHR